MCPELFSHAVRAVVRCVAVAFVAALVAVPAVAQTLAGGRYHTLIVKPDGTVWATGTNNAGQLGDGTYTSRSLPVQVTGLTDVVAVAAGEYHSLAVTSNGSLYVWGSNTLGQLVSDSPKVLPLFDGKVVV